MKNWSFAQSFAFIPGFTFWVYVLGTLFTSWGPLFKNSKNARKSAGSNLIDVIGLPWIHFHGFCCIWFFTFISFSRFFRFTVNVSIFDCNWFVCFLKVSVASITLSFSTRRSIWVLYLVQPWWNCYQHKIYLQESLFRFLRKCSSDCGGSSFTRDLSFMPWKLETILCFKVYLPFPINMLTSLGLRWNSQTRALLTLNLSALSFLRYLEMDCNLCFPLLMENENNNNNNKTIPVFDSILFSVLYCVLFIHFGTREQFPQPLFFTFAERISSWYEITV